MDQWLGEPGKRDWTMLNPGKIERVFEGVNMGQLHVQNAELHLGSVGLAAHQKKRIHVLGEGDGVTRWSVGRGLANRQQDWSY